MIKLTETHPNNKFLIKKANQLYLCHTKYIIPSHVSIFIYCFLVFRRHDVF